MFCSGGEKWYLSKNETFKSFGALRLCCLWVKIVECFRLKQGTNDREIDTGNAGGTSLINCGDLISSLSSYGSSSVNAVASISSSTPEQSLSSTSNVTTGGGLPLQHVSNTRLAGRIMQMLGMWKLWVECLERPWNSPRNSLSHHFFSYSYNVEMLIETAK